MSDQNLTTAELDEAAKALAFARSLHKGCLSDRDSALLRRAITAARRSLEQDERIRELEETLGEVQRENELLRCGSLPSDLEGRERALGER